MTSPPGVPGAGGPKVGIVEGWEIRHAQRKQANAGAWKGLVFVVGLLLVLIIGGWIAARPVLGPAITGFFESNPGIVRIPILADILAAEFADRVNTPAGTSDTAIKFFVEEGETIEEIEAKLVEQGLVTDTEAFTYEVVKDDKDQLIVAGQYTMTPQFTPAQVVEKLAGNVDPPTPKITLALKPGWRIEQIVAYLQQEKEQSGLEMDVRAFRDLALDPSAELADQFKFLKQIPDGNNLEGFLAHGVYEVDIDIEPDAFLGSLLTEWQRRSGDLVAKAAKAKVPFYDALRIASLVERETPLDKERPLVAGVYWNRIDPKVNGPTAGLMQADPTVVYAADTAELADTKLSDWDRYVFWDTLGVDLNTVDVPNRLSSFQTYRKTGLPDWPITTPTRSSLEAAISPNTKKKFLFFVSCPGESKHTFSKSVNKHNRNVRACGLPT